MRIWKFSEILNRTNTTKLDTYSWKCDTRNVLSFQRIERRIDPKTAPSSILMTNPFLLESNTSYLGSDYLSWADFWMRKGTSLVYYMDKIENDSTTAETLRIFAKQYPENGELTHIQDYLSTNSRDGVILLREPR